MKCIQILSLSLIYPRKQDDRDSRSCYEKTTETTRPRNSRGLDGSPGFKASLDQVQPQKVLAGVALMPEWVAGDLCVAVNFPYTRAQIHSPGQDHELLGFTVSTGHVQRRMPYSKQIYPVNSKPRHLLLPAEYNSSPPPRCCPTYLVA